MSTATTTPPADPAATVRHYLECFNQGNPKAVAAVCADPMSILDGMAPHVWHGPTATEEWYRDAMIEAEHLSVTNYSVTLGEPKHNDITGDSAYVVFPATMSFKLQGMGITQTGAYFTAALRKIDDAWRIVSWGWAKGAAKPDA
jgi:hypothetical protein